MFLSNLLKISVVVMTITVLTSVSSAYIPPTGDVGVDALVDEVARGWGIYGNDCEDAPRVATKQMMRDLLASPTRIEIAGHYSSGTNSVTSPQVDAAQVYRMFSAHGISTIRIDVYINQESYAFPSNCAAPVKFCGYRTAQVVIMHELLHAWLIDNGFSGFELGSMRAGYAHQETVLVQFENSFRRSTNIAGKYGGAFPEIGCQRLNYGCNQFPASAEVLCSHDDTSAPQCTYYGPSVSGVVETCATTTASCSACSRPPGQ